MSGLLRARASDFGSEQWSKTSRGRGRASTDLAEGAAIAVFLFPLLVAVAIAFLRVARRAEVQ